MEIIVSGYSYENFNSIQKVVLNENFKMAGEIWSDSIENPSFLSHYENFLFAVTEKTNEALVHMYKRDEQGYCLIDSKRVEGGLLCHINYLPLNKVLVGACYQTGHIFSVKVNENGFGKTVSSIRQGGSFNEVLSRAHCVTKDKNENFLYAVNIALDRVYVYVINDGHLQKNPEFEYLQMEKGEGARHMVFHPNLKETAYIITEYSNKLYTLECKETTGKLCIKDRISTLPDDFRKKSQGSTLSITEDARYLYAANRGADTIGVFKLDDYGIPRKIIDCSCFGKWPRHISLINNHILIANQSSHEIVVCELCRKSGGLMSPVERIPFNNPSYVSEVSF